LQYITACLELALALAGLFLFQELQSLEA